MTPEHGEQSLWQKKRLNECEWQAFGICGREKDSYDGLAASTPSYSSPWVPP